MASRRDDVDQFPFRNVQVPAVLGVHGDIARLVGQAGQDAAVAGHGADRIMSYLADRSQRKGIFGVFPFADRRIRIVVEMAFVVGRGEMAAFMEDRRARVGRFFRRTGPLDAVVGGGFFIGRAGKFGT